MTVRQRPLDLEVLVKIDQLAAGEHRPDRVDDLRRKMREVPEVLVADLPALAVGTAKELRRVHRPVLPFRPDCGHVSRTTTLRYVNNIMPGAPNIRTPPVGYQL